MFHGATIPTPLLIARENRIERTKYVKRARAIKGDRVFELGMAAMYKRHELAWMETYKEDYPE